MREDDPVRRHWALSRLQWQGVPDAAEPWESLTAEPAGVEHRETDAGGAPALWVEPRETADGAVMMYIHGGGFVSGSVWTHRKLAGHLAAATGTRALLVTYSYAPEHVHPEQLDQVTRAYTWLLEQGTDPARLVLAGDSCGAWLAVSLAVRARDRGLPLPAALLLISPLVDLTQSGASYRTNAATDPFFAKEIVDGLAAGFLGPASATDPGIDLLQADLTGLPPMKIQVGGDEALLDDSRALHAIAGKTGVESDLEVFEGQLHTFQMAAGTTDAADQAIRSFAAWYARRS
ncbi:alpha/beta hydrolase [Dactylosporangium sp. NPDC049525]|uniref:alpha/beta hydrolase n=1 Tax=Dactylosporangium sp. NPDC049525 TaxID=3154730 RepID=UPI00343E9E1A